jgi:hypothetical protein
MNKILFGLAAFASLSLTACGGNFCDDLEDLNKDVADDAKECGLDSGTPDEVTDEDRDACKEAYDSCSDSDKDKLDAFVSCVKDIKGCSDKTSAEQQRYANDIVKCATDNLATVSNACGVAG